jgi:hypothetical protein
MINKEMLTSLQDNMLTLKNINNFTKHIFSTQHEEIINTKLSKNNINNNNNVLSKENIYKVKHKDTLFWCFYILKYGISKYEIDSDKYFFTIEKEEKYKYISNIRTNKELLKKNGVKGLTDIENDLGFQSDISIKTFIVLCIIENINIFLVDNRKYYELIIQPNNNINIIQKDNNKKNIYFIDFDNNDTKLENYRNNYLLINPFKDNKLKSISSYKLEELIELAKRLEIDILKDSDNKTKRVTKKYIYEKLIINPIFRD